MLIEADCLFISAMRRLVARDLRGESRTTRIAHDCLLRTRTQREKKPRNLFDTRFFL